MGWCIPGAVVSLIAARRIKVRSPGKKGIYQAALILAVSFLLAGLAGRLDQEEAQKNQVARNKPGQGLQEKEFLLDVEGELESYPVQLEIAEKKLGKAEKKHYLKQAQKELDKVILGKNASKEQISESLYLPEYLQGGIVEATYQFSDYEIFRPDGSFEQEPKEPVPVEITAELSCQEEICLYRFFVQAVPREKSRQEEISQKIKELAEAENQQENKDYVSLPQKVEGKRILWRENTPSRGRILIFLGTVLAVGAVYREREEKKRQKSEREKQMLLDYSSIVSKLSLLLGAGMNISLAWEKIALTYQKKRDTKEIKVRYAYEEMLNTLHEIREGVGELQAYENFGVRCQLGVYRRLSALIVQNVRKGARGMQKLLEREEWEAYEQRKAQARQAGEEAGTKLLFPMGIMLVIVLAILVIPAGMTLNLSM